MGLIPEFVETIHDKDTWLLMGDYWEERDIDNYIACRIILLIGDVRVIFAALPSLWICLLGLAT